MERKTLKNEDKVFKRLKKITKLYLTSFGYLLILVDLCRATQKEIVLITGTMNAYINMYCILTHYY